MGGAIYGNSPLKNAGQALLRGGAASSGINYLSDSLDTRKIREDALRRMAQGSVSPYARRSDPSGLCSVPDPFAGGVGYPAVRGYQYEGHTATGTAGKGGFNLADFGKELLTGFVAGGLSSAAFYGAGKAVEAVKGSVRGVGKGSSNTRLNTYGDALREKLGPAYLSHPEEYNAILNKAKEMGVSVEFREGTLAYDMKFGKPGKLIIDPEASIGALKHEYRHMLDDFSLEHPGMRIIADSDKFWELEFRGYLEELNLAREIKDYGAGKFIIGEMRQRKMEIWGK